MTEPPLAGTFMVAGGTTEKSIGLYDNYCCCSFYFLFSMLPLEDEPLEDLSLALGWLGPHITADNLAKLKSTSIS